MSTTHGSGRFTDGRVPDPGIRAIYDPRNRWQRCLDVEAALARAQARLGLIPQNAADAITAAARIDQMGVAAIEQEITRESHPLMPLISALAEAAGPDGEWAHWGATTQNITQTAETLLLRDAHRQLLVLLGRTMDAAIDLAERTADVTMAGRTHGQHAVPITFGYKVAVWLDQFTRHRERLRQVEPRVLTAMAGGAVGTFASTGEIGVAVQAELAAELDLAPIPVASRAINDSFAEYVTILGLLSGTASQIAHEVHTLMEPEFGEAFEPIPAGTVGSSTMPHKRNPQLTQDVLSISAQIRALVPLALEGMIHGHEVDGSASDTMDQALRQSVILGGDILVRLQTIVGGLTINQDRMARNLNLTGGLIESERIMMTLAESIGRQNAHDVVYRAAQRAATTDVTFEDALTDEPDVAAALDRPQLRAILATRRTGVDELIIAETIARARKGV